MRTKTKITIQRVFVFRKISYSSSNINLTDQKLLNSKLSESFDWEYKENTTSSGETRGEVIFGGTTDYTND
jgi:hypothetical protein